MKKFVIILLTLLLGCKSQDEYPNFLTKEIPNHLPIVFKNDLIPEGKIIHRGIFNPNLQEYYYTMSDTNFKKFEIYRIHRLNNRWSEPELAFMNSEFNEHGMSFSPDGNTIYFSSTRPVPIKGVSSTWHLWKSEKFNDQWNEPVFVDIPNLRDRLVSHPTITASGNLYFHSSNLDFSEMSIYQSKEVKGVFQQARRVSFFDDPDIGTCTPYVSPDEDFLIFALIGNQLDLMISHKDGQGHWSNPQNLGEKININGQGNPYVTPDNKFLFFTSAQPGGQWEIRWVNIESELKNNLK